ncbi:hypothetical protein [Streptomyces collinus]|nr:hypothetical protein [Streptomyces collinus]
METVETRSERPEGAVGMEIKKVVVREDRSTGRRPAILEKRPTR